MEDAMVSSRMARGKKEAGAAILGQLGVTPSAAVNQLYDFVIENGALPFGDRSAKRKRLTKRQIAEAAAWLDDVSLPTGNRFSTMSDDDIRRERLASQGLGEGGVL